MSHGVRSTGQQSTQLKCQFSPAEFSRISRASSPGPRSLRCCGESVLLGGLWLGDRGPQRGRGVQGTRVRRPESRPQSRAGEQCSQPHTAAVGGPWRWVGPAPSEAAMSAPAFPDASGELFLWLL